MADTLSKRFINYLTTSAAAKQGMMLIIVVLDFFFTFFFGEGGSLFTLTLRSKQTLLCHETSTLCVRYMYSQLMSTDGKLTPCHLSK